MSLPGEEWLVQFPLLADGCCHLPSIQGSAEHVEGANEYILQMRGLGAIAEVSQGVYDT